MIQEQDCCHFLSEEVNQNSFFQRLDYDEERKFTTPIMTGYKIQEDVPEIMTKKGRPKGERTSQGKSKKKKVTEGEEGNSNMKSGHWGLQENKKYHWFLEIYNSHFMNKHMRRMDKIFKTMANFIETREAQQCRSHHQKMEKKYNSFCKILLSLRRNHYGTHDPTPIQYDISGFNLSLERPLLSQQQLQVQETACSPTSTSVQVRTLQFQQKQPQQDSFQLMGNQTQFDPIADLFNDQKYQNNLDLGLF